MQSNLTELQIRKKLASYLAGRTSLRAFRGWLSLATWDIEGWAPARLQELVYSIKLRLAEYTSGHWSKAELRTKLMPFVTSLQAAVAAKGLTSKPMLQTSAMSRILTLPLRMLGTVQWLRHLLSGTSAQSVVASV